MTGAAESVREQAACARESAQALASADSGARTAAIEYAAGFVEEREAAILAANSRDLDRAGERGLSAAMIDRLTLDSGRVRGIADSLREVAGLPDPLGATIGEWSRPNGLRIRRVRMPLGVIGVIFESRPNVCADAGGLCIKSGNAVVLRGGSDSTESTAALHECLVAGLAQAGLPPAAVQRVGTTDRAAVGLMLAGCDGAIDVIVPRGGRSLVERVEREARVPVFAHLEGICHIYVAAAADLAKARTVVLNAKLRRTGICGAAECLLVDRTVVDTHLLPMLDDLLEAGCEIRGDPDVVAADARVIPAREEDWGREFLDAILAVRLVDGLDEAVAHIRKYGSSHTDAIITEDDAVAAGFFHALDSAILMRNASTQFADGGEFGLGAEIGIATGRFHARGPIGVEQLTTFQYHVEGDGAVRP